MAVDIRSQLGLPPSAPDEQVERYLSDLRTRALGNLAGPPGWTGLAEDARAVVFESFVEDPPSSFIDTEFEGAVEAVTVTPAGSGSRVTARVLKDGNKAIDPSAPGDPRPAKREMEEPNK